MEYKDFNYELLFELSSDLLCIAGYDGYFKKINPAVSKVLGYTMEELYSRPINDFVYEEDKSITSKARTELTKAKPLLNFENRYRTKSGEIVWLSWTSHPVESEQLIFAIAKNITHKKLQESMRNELLANLTEINKDLKNLNYTTSHDLRAPVNNLLSVFSMMDTSKISDLETVELIDILKLAGEKLKNTLNKYVDDLSEKFNLQAKLENVSLEESLQEVLQSISTLIQTSKVTITYDFPKVQTVSFNKSYLESIFSNLITNSIKYARPEALPVIDIYSRTSKGVNQLIYEDNGLGFDLKKVKDKIFNINQKFHYHPDSKGIGLFLVYNHIKSLGGDIKLESKLNEGAKFIISFPV